MYEQGARADDVLVLLSGRATLTVLRKTKNIIVRKLGPGSVSGGLSCFVGVPHRGTVGRVGGCELPVLVQPRARTSFSPPVPLSPSPCPLPPAPSPFPPCQPLLDFPFPKALPNPFPPPHSPDP